MLAFTYFLGYTFALSIFATVLFGVTRLPFFDFSPQTPLPFFALAVTLGVMGRLIRNWIGQE